MPNDTFFKDEMKRKTKELSDREKRVIQERLGLNGNKGKSRSEVCEMFALSEETIRRVEEKAKELLSK
jgi:RNA polymerase primary sigma factor